MSTRPATTAHSTGEARSSCKGRGRLWPPALGLQLRLSEPATAWAAHRRAHRAELQPHFHHINRLDDARRQHSRQAAVEEGLDVLPYRLGCRLHLPQLGLRCVYGLGHRRSKLSARGVSAPLRSGAPPQLQASAPAKALLLARCELPQRTAGSTELDQPHCAEVGKYLARSAEQTALFSSTDGCNSWPLKTCFKLPASQPLEATLPVQQGWSEVLVWRARLNCCYWDRLRGEGSCALKARASCTAGPRPARARAPATASDSQPLYSRPQRRCVLRSRSYSSQANPAGAPQGQLTSHVACCCQAWMRTPVSAAC